MSAPDTSQITGGTVASPAYRPHARVLAASFLEHHPDGRFVVADLGAVDPQGNEQAPLGIDDGRVEIVHPEILAGSREELSKLGMAYSTQGLAGAMKPLLLRYLVEAGRSPAILIDSDICVFGALDPVVDLLSRHGTVVTPHLINPSLEAEYPTLLAGVFNTGFVAVGEAGAPLLDWWVERTRRECVFRPHRGIIWEQAWLGLAPAFFPLKVMRHPGVNAMTPGLMDGTDVVWDGDRPQISGQPLLCFHFSGPYDPREPDYLLATSPDGVDVVKRGGSYGPGDLPWLALHNRPGAQRMSNAYAERLLAAGYESSRGAAAPFTALPGGPVVHRAMREAYRVALIAHERGVGEAPPNPFAGASAAEFIEWLSEAPSEAAAAADISRFALAAWSAQGLVSAFPEVPGKDAAAYLGWLGARFGPEVEGIPPRLRPGGAARAGRRRFGGRGT